MGLDLNKYLAYLQNKVSEHEQDDFQEFTKQMDAQAAKREKDRANGSALMEKVAQSFYQTDDEKAAARKKDYLDLASALR